jgi:hypothetical protein
LLDQFFSYLWASPHVTSESAVSDQVGNSDFPVLLGFREQDTDNPAQNLLLQMGFESSGNVL